VTLGVFRGAVMVRVLAICLLMGACAARPDLQTQLSAQDLLMNNPATQRPQALFRMFADGSGQANFVNNPSGAQDISWHLEGRILCIETHRGVFATSGCARLTLDDAQVTLRYGATGPVMTGTLVAR